jgi:hypothetical protein
LSPYRGVNLAKVCRSGEKWLSGMNRSAAKELSVSARAMICVTFSEPAGSRRKAEGGEQQGSDPYAQPRDDPQVLPGPAMSAS